MSKIKKMITLLGVVLLCIFLIVSFSGANPGAQLRTLPPIKPDSNLSIPVPKIFLEQALKDSIQKRDKIRKSNDSLFVVRKHKSDRILRMIHNLVHKKTMVTKDTIYLTYPFISDSLYNKDLNYLNKVNLIQWQ